ncbi:hypothetical protein [Serratia marcescens]|uniref:hypothetical protein n=1 Tax=Serratia marcescens TaxID=615 RepID=UPI003989D43C
MTNAIEQLIKMHDLRCVSAESMNVGRGCASPTREQILGALAAVQHWHSVGLELLMLSPDIQRGVGEVDPQAGKKIIGKELGILVSVAMASSSFQV